jgi:hypothetical protein
MLQEVIAGQVGTNVHDADAVAPAATVTDTGHELYPARVKVTVCVPTGTFVSVAGVSTPG